jgi:hypothetical protein
MSSQEKQTIIRYQLIVVIVGILLLIAKFTAYELTHSNTILRMRYRVSLMLLPEFLPSTVST